MTPAFIREAAAEALHRGETFYGPNRGIPQLRDAIQRYTSRIYGAEVDLDRRLAFGYAQNRWIRGAHELDRSRRILEAVYASLAR